MLDACDQEMRLKNIRIKELEIETMVDRRSRNYKHCKDMVLKLLQLTDIAYEHLQENNVFEIEKRFLLEELRLFKEEQPLLGQKEKHKESVCLLANKEREDYLFARNWWAFIPARKDEPVEPTEDNAIPEQPVDNKQFGNLVRSILKETYPQDKVKVVPVATRDQIVVSVGGLSFAGKKDLSRKFCE